MLYCEGCGLLYDGEKCPWCRRRNGRAPEADDLCFLTERGQIESDMLGDILEQNGIPCLKKSVSGAGIAMYTGLMLESFKIFVKYSDYDRAGEIAEAFFTPLEQTDEGGETNEPDDDQE